VELEESIMPDSFHCERLIKAFAEDVSPSLAQAAFRESVFRGDGASETGGSWFSWLVWRAFTHATALRDWFSNEALVQTRLNGFLVFTWNDGYSAIGQVTHFDPPHGLDFAWFSPQDPGPTQVSLRFRPAGDGILVELEHAGFGDGAQWEADRQEKQRAWEAALENLESFLLEGIDLRMARRPRLGIWMDELTPDLAGKLGLPEPKGVLLAGTAPGSGAEAAGLVKDDVLVSLNGVPLEGPNSFGLALKGLLAGDRPLVEFFRGGNKLNTPLELGHFPISPLPESPAALAGEVRQTNAHIRAAIQEQTEGLTEDQAKQRPLENEWSVNEIIGHFILTERDYQSWAADMLRDNVVGDYLQFRPNVDERIAALLKRFPTLAELRVELENAQEETAALLEALPDHFTTWRKHLYRRLADWSREVTPGHLDEEHAAQLQAAVEAARKY
jgi:uncharacterized protein YndB with AHSA1/START domain